MSSFGMNLNPKISIATIDDESASSEQVNLWDGLK